MQAIYNHWTGLASNEKIIVSNGRYVLTIYVLINLHSRNQSTVVEKVSEGVSYQHCYKGWSAQLGN